MGITTAEKHCSSGSILHSEHKKISGGNQLTPTRYPVPEVGLEPTQP